MDTQNAVAGNESSAFSGGDFVTLTSDIVAAYVGSSANHINPDQIPALITDVHAALRGIGGGSAEPQVKQEPAVSIRSSVKPDYIVCLEDGKKLKMLKRYLNTKFGMTPDQYRAKWGLPADYPMVAPNYAEQRRELAKSIGLGTTRTRSTGAATGGRGRKANGNGNGNGATASRGRKTTATGKVDGRTKAARAAKGGRGRKATNA